MAANPELEVCPRCGEFVTRLVSHTGWCKSCSYTTESGKYSLQNKFERFLASNADHIEHHILKGKSLYVAIKAVRDDVRPTCARCGGLMNRARRGSVFCHKNKECIAAYNHYVYLHRGKGLSKAQALAITLSELKREVS